MIASVTSCAEAPTANIDSPMRVARSSTRGTVRSSMTGMASVCATADGSVCNRRRTEESSGRREFADIWSILSPVPPIARKTVRSSATRTRRTGEIE
ncbi:hypothetical protein MOX01_08810 [Microbacterium oxydans]|nr:hypothetical protein MOX01_08810 [Microbacterium oxydans]